MRSYQSKKLYYENRTVFGMKAIFYILIGARGCGKTYSTQNYCLRRFFKTGEPFLWLRLTEASTKKLLQNDAKDFIDTKLQEKWGIRGFKVSGNIVSAIIGYDKNTKPILKEFCRIMALSTFYSSKGVALNKANLSSEEKRIKKNEEATVKRNVQKYKTIVLDEMNREKNEKKSFDICYAFVNQLETICRTDIDRRIILMGNTLDEASDILATQFNFIPDKLGIYRLHNKRAVIHYIKDSIEYIEARKKSLAGILSPNESTFTNVIVSDKDLLKTPSANAKGSYMVRFDESSYFTVKGDIVTLEKQPKHSKLSTIAMKPYIRGYAYYKEQANMIIELVQQRALYYDKLVTLKMFQSKIKLLKEK